MVQAVFEAFYKRRIVTVNALNCQKDIAQTVIDLHAMDELKFGRVG
jgi:predicted transposase YbfD/YdcC